MRVSLEDTIPQPCPRRKTSAVQGCTLPGIYAQHHILLPGSLCDHAQHLGRLVKHREYPFDIRLKCIPVYRRTEGDVETIRPCLHVLSHAVDDLWGCPGYRPQTLGRWECLEFVAGDFGPRLIGAHVEVQVDTALQSRWITVQLLAGSLEPLLILFELFR